MKGLVILLIASITLCEAAHKRKNFKRGVQYDEFVESDFQNPSQNNPWRPQQFESQDFGMDSNEGGEDDDEEEEEEDDSHAFDHHLEQQQQQQQQSFVDDIDSWEDEKPTTPQWNTQWTSNANSGWSSMGGGGAVKTKTIIKKIPVPYERPIKVDNPIYTPIEKHIPIEHPVPIIKWVEKNVPTYVDQPVISPTVKEEHIPQPYKQKVRVILQKVYVHVPAPQQTIIIRKKLARRHANIDKIHRMHEKIFRWL